MLAKYRFSHGIHHIYIYIYILGRPLFVWDIFFLDLHLVPPPKKLWLDKKRIVPKFYAPWTTPTLPDLRLKFEKWRFSCRKWTPVSLELTGEKKFFR